MSSYSSSPGLFIVLEGADGAGKATQFKLLAERLRAVGYGVEIFDFPNYSSESSYFVKRYLNGEYGSASSISPYTASLFYALDRYEASPKIKQSLHEGKIVLSNRYVGSNMAHQGSKIINLAEQRGFFIWAEALEYNLLEIPRPNINIFLRVPPTISFELIEKKSKRGYTDKKRDEHEADIEHLSAAVRAYETLSLLFPRDFRTIECVQNGELLSIPEISNLIWDSIKPMLPPAPDHGGMELILSLELINQDIKKGNKPKKPQLPNKTTSKAPNKPDKKRKNSKTHRKRPPKT